MLTTFLHTLNITVSNGSSGGPLLNEKGEVIGIITKGIEYENFNFAIIPYGIQQVIADYNKVGFNNAGLVPESDFILTQNDIENIHNMTDTNIKGLFNESRDLCFSIFYPASELINIEKANFKKSVQILEGYTGYAIQDIASSKYGNTIMSIGSIKLFKNTEYDILTVVSRFKLDVSSHHYKIMATFTTIESDVADENIPDNTEVEKPPVIVDPTYDYYEELKFKPSDVKFDQEKGFIYMIDKLYMVNTVLTGGKKISKAI